MIATLVAAWCAAAPPAHAPYEVQPVVPGVHVVMRREPPGLWFDSNSVFIVGARDVVVVDTNVSPESARASLAELRRITDKPVRYVVNTHWHDDHLAGNQVYRDAFPGVQFVGHVRTREELSTTGAENRKQAQTNGRRASLRLCASGSRTARASRARRSRTRNVPPT